MNQRKRRNKIKAYEEKEERERIRKTTRKENETTEGEPQEDKEQKVAE